LCWLIGVASKLVTSGPIVDGAVVLELVIDKLIGGGAFKLVTNGLAVDDASVLELDVNTLIEAGARVTVRVSQVVLVTVMVVVVVLSSDWASARPKRRSMAVGDPSLTATTAAEALPASASAKMAVPARIVWRL